MPAMRNITVLWPLSQATQHTNRMAESLSYASQPTDIIFQKAPFFSKSPLVYTVIIKKGKLKWRNINRLTQGEISALQQKCFLRGRGEPAHCDPCGIAQPTNNVPPCWPSSQLQLQLRLKIDNQRESSGESKGLLENSTAIFDSPFTALYKIQVKSFFYTGYSVHTSIIL